MSKNPEYVAPSRSTPETRQRGEDKLSRIPVKLETSQTWLRKPAWSRAKMPVVDRVNRIKRLLSESGLSSVCEEAACPNLRERFDHGCNMLTLGQYLQPSREHLPIARFVAPEEFEHLRMLGESMGFSSVAGGPMVRSSYHADLQANPLLNPGTG